mgnify:CR=1 FL=1
MKRVLIWNIYWLEPNENPFRNRGKPPLLLFILIFFYSFSLQLQNLVMEMRQELNDQKILIPNEISDRLMMIIVKEQRSIRNFLPIRRWKKLIFKLFIFDLDDKWRRKRITYQRRLPFLLILKIQTKSSFFHLFDQQIKHENPFNQRSV